jgi:phage-related protein
MAESVKAQYELLLDRAERDYRAFISFLDRQGANVGSKLGNNIGDGVDRGVTRSQASFSRLGRIIDSTIGNALGNLVFSGINTLTNTLTSSIGGAINAGIESERSQIQLEVIAPRVGVTDLDALNQEVDAVATDLRLSTTTVQNALTDIFQAFEGTELEGDIGSAVDLLRRFNNEAITGRSAGVGLNTAITNLAFAYKTQNSALGNASGISENFSDIQKEGLAILQEQGQLLGLTVGQLNSAQKAQAQYAGIIDLTNKTAGSSDLINQSLAGTINLITANFERAQQTIGQKFNPVLQSALTPVAELSFLLTDLASSADFQPLVDGIQGFGNSLSEIDFRAVFDTIVGAFQELDATFRPSITSLVDSIGNLFQALAENPAVQQRVDDFLNLGNQILDLAQAVLPVAIQGLADFFNTIAENEAVLTAFVIGISSVSASLATLKIIGVLTGIVSAVGSVLAILGTAVPVVSLIISQIIAGGGVLASIVQGLSLVGITVKASTVALALLSGGIAVLVGVAVGLFLAWQTNFLGIQDITRSVIDFVINTFNDVVTFLGEFGANTLSNLQTQWGSIVDFFNTSLQNIQTFFVDTFNGIRDFINTAISEITTAFEAGPEGWRDLFFRALNGLGEIVTNVFVSVGGFFSEQIANITNIITTGFNSFTEIVTNALIGVFNAVVTYLGFVQDFWQNTFNGVRDFLQNVLDTIITLVAGFFLLLVAPFRDDTSVEEAWALTTGKLGRIWGETIDGIIAVAQSLFGGIFQAFTSVFNFIGEFITNFQNAFDGFLNSATQAIISFGINAVLFFGQAFLNVQSTVNQITNNILNGVGEFIQNTINFFASLPDRIQNFFNQLLNFTITFSSNLIREGIKLGSEFVNNIIRFIQELPGRVQNFFSQLLTNSVTFSIQFANNAREAGIQFIDNVSNFLRNLPGNVQRFLSDTIANARQFATDFANQARQSASDFISAIQNGLSGLRDTVFTTVSNAFDTLRNINLFQIGVDIVNGLINGIRQTIANVGGVLTSGLNSAVDAAKNFLRSDSPSKLFEDIGIDTVQGYINGLDNLAPKASEAILNPLEFSVDNLPEVTISDVPSPSFASTNGNTNGIINNNTTNNTNTSTNNNINYGNNFALFDLNQFAYDIQ